MTSTIKVNTVTVESGCTMTLGESGKTVALASGASQTGFGRTGTVNWQTTVKTTGFTAVSGEGYFCNTSAGAFTVTLPASPSAEDIVAIKDYANTADTYNITIGRNGSKIDGQAEDAKILNEGGSVTLVYVDTTKGWLITDSAQASDLGFPEFVAATGGTITTVCTNYKIHTFTGPGTFCVSNAGNAAGSNTVDYLVVAGGGGTPGLNYNNTPSGGGGAGGLRASATTYAIGCNPAKPLVCGVSALPVSATGFPITVGAGGAGGSAGPGNAGSPGDASSFSTITSAGGGRSGHPPSGAAQNGGSGGGGTADAAGGTGNTPPVSPAQGNPGGVGVTYPTNPSPGSDNTGIGGGGGAIQTGFNGGSVGNPPGGGGDGGDGAGFTDGAFGAANGECVSCVQYFAGGGGGGVYTPNPSPNPGGIGGLGGGGNGGSPANPSCVTSPARVGQAGTANTGGGGASSGGGPSPSSPFVGQAGGSGIVVIRYKFQ